MIHEFLTGGFNQSSFYQEYFHALNVLENSKFFDVHPGLNSKTADLENRWLN